MTTTISPRIAEVTRQTAETRIARVLPQGDLQAHARAVEMRLTCQVQW